MGLTHAKSFYMVWGKENFGRKGGKTLLMQAFVERAMEFDLYLEKSGNSLKDFRIMTVSSSSSPLPP